MPQRREKFTAQVNAKVLAAVRELAEKEGRQTHSLVEEALVDLVAKHRSVRPRPYVMAVYQASHEKYASLYTDLAD